MRGLPRLWSLPLLMLAAPSCFSGSAARPAGGDGSAGGSMAARGGGAGGAGGAAGGQSGQGGAGDEIQAIIATYRTWQPQSAAAVDISAQIFALCRPPTGVEMEFTQSAHSRFQLRDWANPEAVAGLARHGAGGYAVGSVIVKEKFAALTPGGAFELAALGMMIKRPPGFDSTGGDWEFVYSTAETVLRGPTELLECTSCHSRTTATDFVYGADSWYGPGH